MCGLNENGLMDGRACDHPCYTHPRICTQTCSHALICNRRNKGIAVLLIPGGASEVLLSEPGFYNIVPSFLIFGMLFCCSGGMLWTLTFSYVALDVWHVRYHMSLASRTQAHLTFQ